ncbi:regulatory signaling modulator protein AmpE [Pseudomonas lurida]|jgi:AmpE protein|uniref:Regulatory signaling modulator protein AmpE n=1 Tax=Pseudomonas quebecensis TaxID=2995174 RepID=A0ABY6QD45_9PSED|nr:MULTISPECIES: regulatory signaling modulator protein AmpE [Pseudomonas]MBA1294341.1 regulatory signaling modulator protein AmpE [Pseudomonas lurida]MCP1514498.1 AmpE protein [Pseudomonas rhodesiae]MCX4063605.1 regulatory signaling modulator protein AmpE [Pseudomonas quebecensis]MDF9768218.1 AmpE protein [Pseudomonas rhodesiae]UZW17719.1 regulatory signaling modulator protein AmpE [Pseudomonas quebecensis]
MSFLVLVLAVWIEKFSALRHRLQRDGGWLRELARLESSPRLAQRPWLILTLLVLLPVAVLALLLMVLEPVAYGLLALPVHLLVVIYSLGRGDLLADLGPFRDAWRRGDLQAAEHVAERDLALGADSGEQLLERVQGHLLWQAYQSFFAVIFWYFLLGPVAALAYRLLALASEHSLNPLVAERAGQLRHAFDWLPVRLLAASFALVGNFVAVSRVMLHELLSWDISAAQLVEKVGLAAAEIPAPAVGAEGINSLDRLWELLLRAAVLWYAGFAIWTVLP